MTTGTARLVSALVTALVWAAAPAPAGTLARTETQSYEPANHGAGAHRLHPIVAEVVFFTTASENHVSFEIADASARPAMAVVYVRGEEATHFCGSLPKPMFVEPSSEVSVRILAGHCFDGTLSTPSTGEVTASFLRLPVRSGREEMESYALETREAYGARPEGTLAATASFEPGPQTRVSFRIDDESGGNVLGEIEQNGNTVAEFCGATDQPVEVAPHVPIEIVLWTGTCTSGEPSTGTRGSITAVYLN